MKIFMGLIALVTLAWSNGREEVAQQEDPENANYPTTTAKTRSRRAGPPPPPTPIRFATRDFAGYYVESLYWLNVKQEPKYKCMATFVAYQVAITPCECVVISTGPKIHTVDAHSHDGWYLTDSGDYLPRRAPSDLTVSSFTNPKIKDKRVTELYVNEQCTSYFTHNIAAIFTEKIPDLRLAWVHTPEELLFYQNLNRVITGQSINGYCTVPWYDFTVDQASSGLPITADKFQSYEVNFQQWDRCRPIVCPDWNQSFATFDEFSEQFESKKEALNPYVRNVCVDSVDHTKACLDVRMPIEIQEPEGCRIPPGLPVSCNVGDVSGLFGFVVTATFDCNSTGNEQLAIFQPLSLSLKWLHTYLSVRLDPKYGDEEHNDFHRNPNLPKWMWNIKKPPNLLHFLENQETTIRQGIPGVDAASDIFLSVWGRDMTDTIINVFSIAGRYSKVQCQGVQISPKNFVIPCLCGYKVETPEGEFRHVLWGDPDDFIAIRRERLIKRNLKNLNVRLAKYDTKREPCELIESVEQYRWNKPPRYFDYKKQMPFCYAVESISKSKDCDNTGFANFGLLTTSVNVHWAKNAWIHTSDVEYFKKAWELLPAASLIEGRCFYLQYAYYDVDDDGIEVTKVNITRYPIKFSPFDFCTPLVCDPETNYISALEQEFCFNYRVKLSADNDIYTAKRIRSENNFRECISDTYERATCHLLDGTPIFCDTDELRGLIGFVSKYSMPGCTQKVKSKSGKDPREIVDKHFANSSAVIMRIDGYLEEIGPKTIIYGLERDADFINVRRSRPSSTTPTFALIFIIISCDFFLFTRQLIFHTFSFRRNIIFYILHFTY